MNTNASPALPPAAFVNQLLEGYQRARLVQVAAKLDLHNVIGTTPKSSLELATLLRLETSLCYRFLRAIAALGLIDELPNERFCANTRTHALPIADNVMFGDESYKAWDKLADMLRTGVPAFQAVYKQPIYEYIGANPSRQQRWNEWCAETSTAWFADVIANLPLQGASSIVDVGGGDGTLLRAVLARNPGVHGTLFDLPEAVASAPKNLAAGDLTRFSVVAGDMFASVPGGHDLYLLSRVLFNWSDEDAVRILRNCRTAAKPGARICVIENVMPPLRHPLRSVFSINDLNLYAMFGSRHHEVDDITGFLTQAGISYEQTIECTNSSWHIFLGRVG
jgi:precorrin-6B methylase 2